MKIQVKIMSMLILFIAFAFTACKNDAFHAVYAIGDTGPAGGLIFYNRGFYLEAAPSDQSTGVEWGGSGTFTGAAARKVEVGAGATNTTKIVAILGAGTYAAKICDDLDLGGYSDWFLPSTSELLWMFGSLGYRNNNVGNFAKKAYWSSTELSSTTAVYKSFIMASFFYTFNKGQSYRVRAARRVR